VADRNTKIRGIQIHSDVAGDGLAKDVSGNLKINLEVTNPGLAITTDALDVKLKANDGLTKGVDGISVDYDNSSIGIVTNKLAIKASGVTNDMLAGSIADGKLAEDYIQSDEVDDSTIEFASGNVLQVKDAGITENKLAMNDSPSAGEVITWNASGYMEWTSKTATDAVSDTDIKVENESANCNNSNVEFNLASTPVSNSVQVYLNGLLQEEGSGKDYTISGTTVTFADAPLTGDILIIHYIAQG